MSKLANYLRGASTILTIFPDTGDKMLEQFCNQSDAEASKSDAEALRGDWEMVGKDINNAIQRYKDDAW